MSLLLQLIDRRQQLSDLVWLGTTAVVLEAHQLHCTPSLVDHVATPLPHQLPPEALGQPAELGKAQPTRGSSGARKQVLTTSDGRPRDRK